MRMLGENVSLRFEVWMKCVAYSKQLMESRFISGAFEFMLTPIISQRMLSINFVESAPLQKIFFQKLVGHLSSVSLIISSPFNWQGFYLIHIMMLV